MADQTPPPTDPNEVAEAAPNVVPFRAMAGETGAPALSPVESNAFNELARELSARLAREYAAVPSGDEPPAPTTESPEPWIERPANKQPSEPPALGESRRDRTLLDLLPIGVLIYRFDHLLYANPAFLRRMGYSSLRALNQAGGLGALYVEQSVSAASSTLEAGTPATIATDRARPADARLFSISWDDDCALALMLTSGQSASSSPGPPLPASQARAEDLAAILDSTAEGIIMFDASGDIHGCNRSAEALFGYDRAELLKRNLVELFAAQSEGAVLEYLETTRNAADNGPPDPGRAVLGRASHGATIPLSITMGRPRPEASTFFAVLVEPQGKMGEADVRNTPLARRNCGTGADILARIGHDMRSPLNAIDSFAQVMMSERFGPLGNERYVECVEGIRAYTEQVIAIINDLTELSRNGMLDLAPASQNLNELVESCIAKMQPQAKVIIRCSLAQLLPPVVADAPSLRQITMDLIGNSIRLANPGGQVIVSTALSDEGDVVLRVRDTGGGPNGNELAAALAPIRTPQSLDTASDALPINLSLTKALVRANHALLRVETVACSGTLMEVMFAGTPAQTSD